MNKQHKSSDKSERQKFSEETIQALIEYGKVLREIHDGLISEGYVIKNHKIFKDGKDVTKDITNR